MSKKEKVSIMRTEAFASVEDELTLALEDLETTNARIQALLESERGLMGETQLLAGLEAAGAESAAPAGPASDGGVASADPSTVSAG